MAQAITESTRFALQQRAREVLGEQEGDTLMAHLPPVGWADVATKQDIESLRVATKQDIESLRVATKQDIESLRVATKQDVASLRESIVSLREVMQERFSHCAMKADMERGFRRQSMWMGSLFVAQTASLAGLLAVFHA